MGSSIPIAVGAWRFETRIILQAWGLLPPTCCRPFAGMSRGCLFGAASVTVGLVVVGFLSSGEGSIACSRFSPGSRFYTANGNG